MYYRRIQCKSSVPFAELEFQGEYPMAHLKFLDPQVPVEISMEAFNPLIPMELRKSSIPCALFRLTARNNSSDDQEVAFLYAQQNAVGYFPSTKYPGANSSREFFEDHTTYKNLNLVSGNAFSGYGGNSNRIYHRKNATNVHLTKKTFETSSRMGDMTIGLIGEQGQATAEWTTVQSLHDLFLRTGGPGNIPESTYSRKGETVNAAVAQDFRLAPGESRTVTFFLTWHFPKGRRGSYSSNSWGRGRWGGEGNQYANWWADSAEVAAYLQSHFEELYAGTKRYHDSFYASTFPHWLKDRISAQTEYSEDQYNVLGPRWIYSEVGKAFLRMEVLVRGNCTHVWHYAQAHARLFPEMVRTMREQSLGYMKANGMIPYRHPNGHEAFDGQCGEILQAYREHLTGNDGAWLQIHFPKIKKAMEFTIQTWDGNEDGRLTGAKHNTLDSRLGGNSAWHGSLYAAALKATAEMATLQAQPDLARRYRQISEKAVESHLKTLWNGEYFVQIPDPVPRADFLTGCATDQMLGQWWCNQLQLGRLYPAEILTKTMSSIFKHNFKANFVGIRQVPREFVKPEEAGLMMITWPRGGRPSPHTSYADEVMSGFEYAAAATMIDCGNLQEGLTVLKAISDRYNGKLKVGYRGGWGNWGYSGNPFGDDECGKFYSRAMSSWSVLLAMQGFRYNGPEQMIGFDPQWNPENHVSFFTAADGWGRFTQQRGPGWQTNSLLVDYGEMRLSKLQLKVGTIHSPAIVLNLNGESIPTTSNQVGDLHEICWEGSTLNAGDVITIAIRSH